MELVHSGKVRDVYADGDDLILVASDRVSVYDVVLPTAIPDKGRILTQLSLWWFDRLGDVVPNHVISDTERAGRVGRDGPSGAGAWTWCRSSASRAAISPAPDSRSTNERGAVSGVPLPDGLVDGSRLPEPIFTPTTKAPLGAHDEFITLDEVVAQEGAGVAQELRRITLDVYRRGAEVAAPRGIIIADTKIEIGRAPDGRSSSPTRCSPPTPPGSGPPTSGSRAAPQHAFDKQFLRDWAAGTGWDRTPPAPEIPDDIVAATRARYIEAYERITGETWTG